MATRDGLAPAAPWPRGTWTPPGRGGPGGDRRARRHHGGGRLDVTDDGARRRVVAGLFDRHGGAFDLLVTVAGIDRPGYVTAIELADVVHGTSLSAATSGSGAIACNSPRLPSAAPPHASSGSRG